MKTKVKSKVLTLRYGKVHLKKGRLSITMLHMSMKPAKLLEFLSNFVMLYILLTFIFVVEMTHVNNGGQKSKTRIHNDKSQKICSDIDRFYEQ